MLMALCSKQDTLHNKHLAKFCSSKSLLRSVLSGVAPSLLLVLYEAIAMPHAFYRLAVIESQAVGPVPLLHEPPWRCWQGFRDFWESIAGPVPVYTCCSICAFAVDALVVTDACALRVHRLLCSTQRDFVQPL